jgi:hypothetical protein
MKTPKGGRGGPKKKKATTKKTHDINYKSIYIPNIYTRQEAEAEAEHTSKSHRRFGVDVLCWFLF